VPFKDGGTAHHTSPKLKRTVHDNQAEALEKLADEACNLRWEIDQAFGTIPEPGELEPSDYQIGD
jgi:hypothetical protein